MVALQAVPAAFTVKVLLAAIPLTVPLSATPCAASAALMTLLPSTALMVSAGPVSATVTAWLAVATLPLMSVTCADTVAVPLASVVASLEGIVALQAVPAAFTVAV